MSILASVFVRLRWRSTSRGLGTTKIMGTNCTVEEGPDILGLGVRLGVYLQCVSTIITMPMGLDEAIASSMMTSTILAGLLITMVRLTITAGPPPAAVASVMLIQPLAITILRTVANMELTEGIVLTSTQALCLLQTMAWCSFGVWFWVIGVAPTIACEGRGNSLLTSSTLLHYFVLIVITTLTVGILVQIIFRTVGLLFGIVLGEMGVEKLPWPVRLMIEVDRHLRVAMRWLILSIMSCQPMLEVPDTSDFLWCAAVLGGTIFIIEFTIAIGGINGTPRMESSGEIILLTIGATSLVRSLWLATRRARGDDRPRRRGTLNMTEMGELNSQADGPEPQHEHGHEQASTHEQTRREVLEENIRMRPTPMRTTSLI